MRLVWCDCDSDGLRALLHDLRAAGAVAVRSAKEERLPAPAAAAGQRNRATAAGGIVLSALHAADPHRYCMRWPSSACLDGQFLANPILQLRTVRGTVLAASRLIAAAVAFVAVRIIRFEARKCALHLRRARFARVPRVSWRLEEYFGAPQRADQRSTLLSAACHAFNDRCFQSVTLTHCVCWCWCSCSCCCFSVIDFGGATYVEECRRSRVINTRQYRGPEVLLGLDWSYPSDVWSAGCIIAEVPHPTYTNTYTHTYTCTYSCIYTCIYTHLHL